MKLSTLLFDLGGVIMDIKRQCCVEAFRELGMANPDALLGEYVQKGPFLAVERGDVTPAEFRAEMRRHIPREVSDREIDEAFSRFLVGIPVERLRQLEDLGRCYRVCMLSNTNPIMWDGKIAEEFRKDGHDVEYYFPGGIVTSFTAHAVKPDPAIFHTVIRDLGLKPEATLFLDDSKANLDTAASLGFNTALVEPGLEFISLIP